MVRSSTVESQIRMREGFSVSISPRSRTMQSYLDLFPKGAKQNWTVQEWRDSRFLHNYDSFEVSVLYGDGSEAPGQTLLRTVRESYLE